MDKLERVARAICAEKCAFMGEPPCYTVEGEWPNPNCQEPGCHAEAQAAIAALEPVTVQEAARVLLGQWLSGSFEDTADAIADDAIISQWAHVDRTYPDAAPIIEAWLRALAQKDAYVDPAISASRQALKGNDDE